MKEEYKDLGEYISTVHDVKVEKKIVPITSSGSRIRIAKLFDSHEEFIDKVIKVCGWSRSVRDAKDFCFITVTDGSH